MLKLKYEKKGEDSLDKLRATGRTPAVFYGPQEESTSIVVSEAEFKALWKKTGSSAIIVLDGEFGEKEVLINEVVMHPVKDFVMHVDFYAIERGKTLDVDVPFEFMGEAPAEKLGGIVVKVMNEISVTVRPINIPKTIEIDLSKLTELDSVIKISDLDLSDDIEIKADHESVIASISVQKEEEEETAEARDITDVEIEEKGKKEEEPQE